MFNVFISKRISNENSNIGICFKIERVECKTSSETFDAKLESENLV